MRDGSSHWLRRFGNHFGGQNLPFGCLVDFIPSPVYKRPKSTPPGQVPTDKEEESKSEGTKLQRGTKKCDPNMIPGVFLGYKLLSGCEWKGEYKVVALDEFVGLNFHRSCRATDHPVTVQTVREVRMMESKPVFPLRDIYDNHNRTVVGISKWLSPDADLYNCPPPLSAKEKGAKSSLADQIFEDNTDSDGKPRDHQGEK